jgi:hypothetical protein
MKQEEANILLQKYFEAETTLAEEEMLESYFRQGELPEEMIPFKIWFDKLGKKDTDDNGLPFENEMMEIFLQKEQNRKKRVRWISLSGIAASLLIALGTTLYFQQKSTYHDSFDDPAVAMAYASKTLHFVSGKYNKGLAQLRPIHKIGRATLPVKRSLRTIKKGFSEIEKIHIMNSLLK